MTEITCDDCGEAITLRKGYAGALEATCACEASLGVKVSGKIPAGWGE